MKRICKYIFIIFLYALLSALIFSACKKSSLSSEYTAVIDSGDTSYTYSLSLDEKNDTFSMTIDTVPETHYSGSVTHQDGYLILQSEEMGTQYVSFVGDNFYFFDRPSEEGGYCVHDYVAIETVKATCTEKGYTKYECSKCKTVKYEYTDKDTTNHDWEKVEYRKGNCQTEEITVYKCSRCDTSRYITGQKGDHELTADSEMDLGCTKNIVVRNHCKLCGEVFDVEVKEEYGSHSYDEGSDVCKICHYDKNGGCHVHTDEDDDGYCDDCGVLMAAIEDLDRDGYYLSGDTLYFGLYPTDTSAYSVNTIETEGLFDKTTGYYRYKNASYLIKSVTNYNTGKVEKNAFLITYLTWTKIAENGENFTFICNNIVDRSVYLAGTEISGGYKTGTNIPANDYLSSDIYDFANTAFLNVALSYKEKTLLAENSYVSVPSADTAVRATSTDYSVFMSTKTLVTELYFTLTPGESNTEITCLSSYPDVDPESFSVTSVYGFVPVITLNLNIQ